MSTNSAPASWLVGRRRGQARDSALHKKRTGGVLLDLVRVDAAQRFGSSAPEDLDSVDWTNLLELAYREDLAPLLHHTLVQTELGRRKEAPVQKLYFLSRLTRRRSAQAFRQLAEVLPALNDAGIEGIVLKGAALSQGMYTDPGLRPFSDIDILFRQCDVGRAHQLLNDLGYRFNYRGGPIAPPSSTDLKFRSARQYFHQDRDYLSIDLYWQLGRYPYIVPVDYAAWWERAAPATLEDAPALVLSPEDTLLHLSLEFILGLWYGAPEVKYLRDIAEVIHRQDVDWSSLTSRVRPSALASPLYISCRLSQGLLGAEIPGSVLSGIHPRAGCLEDWVVKQLKRHIFGDAHPLKYALLVLLTRLGGPESPGDKLRWLARLAVPPRELWGSIPGRLRAAWLGKTV